MQRRVLVVEDDPAIRRLMSMLLQTEGHAVETAQDGLEALERIESARPDLVLLDLRLPKLGGLGVLQRLGEAPPAPPTVVVSSQTAARQRALQLGAVAFVFKPFDVTSLLSVVSGTLGASPQMPRRPNER